MVTYTKKSIKGKRHCPNCNKLIATGFRICPKCGANLRDANGLAPAPLVDLLTSEPRRGLPIAPPPRPELPSVIQGCEGDIQAAVEFAKRMYGISRAVQLLLTLDAAIKELA